MQKPLKKLSKEEALRKLYRYCVYQERCHQEVNQKLYDWGFYTEERGNIIVHLMEEKFLNEERFACAFVKGKFNQKKWGKVKITQGLKQKGIQDNLIRISLKEIDEIEYLRVLNEVLEKKQSQLTEKNDYIKKNKLANYVINRGFEAELVWDIIR